MAFPCGSRRRLRPSQPGSVLDDLLTAVARGLDVRGLFQHLSAVGSRLIPYDEAQLVVSSEGFAACRFASTQDGTLECVDDTAAETILEGSESRLLDAVPESGRGLQSGLRVPVRIEDDVVGALALFSRRPHAYSPSDLIHAERLASFGSGWRGSG